VLKRVEFTRVAKLRIWEEALPDGPSPQQERTLTSLPEARSRDAPSVGEVFSPGELFADRYQIVSLLGRGGMGVVYRAEDLKLGHSVALKFLPSEVLEDPVMLRYLYAEVRNARQVSHPNVCRVFDIGEHDGRHFLSMEYVDGEDLASLLRRIGRLPPGKALDISREICAGLAAAHDRGVIHRDLKPLNIMIDGRGRARLMDFGLAVRPMAATQTGELAGTPLYMAPELLAGRGASVKSDIYSVGLVLYELFTGAQPFSAPTWEGLRRARETEHALPPSSHAPEIDPAVDRVIMRCLAADPAARPASALEVAASLPGGDPLAAALAAGQTPTPEMVAAADVSGGLKPVAAWCLLVALAVALGAAVALAPRAVLLGRPGLRKSPEVLAERAHEIVASFGYQEEPKDVAYWFEADEDLLVWRAQRRPAGADPAGQTALDARLVRFRYRQSPALLIPSGNQGQVNEENPAVNVPGMVNVDLDAQGRLLRFAAVPLPTSAAGSAEATLDRSALFAAAGLDEKRFVADRSLAAPAVPYGSAEVWTQSSSPAGGTPLTVVTASAQGRPVFFETRGPWVGAAAADTLPLRLTRAFAPNAWFGVLLFLLVAGLYFARRNIRMRRGDSRGAFRVASLAFVALSLGWVLLSHHAYGSLADFMLWVRGGPASFLFDAAFLWVTYMAVEPTMRRYWPEQLISWNRLLAGRFRDPMVGRDIVIGTVVGSFMTVAMFLLDALPSWIWVPGSWFSHLELMSFLGTRGVLGTIVYLVGVSWYFGVGWIAAIVIPQILFRRRWVVIVIFVFFGTVSVLAGFRGDLVGQAVYAFVFSGTLAFCLFRFGNFAAMIAYFVSSVLTRIPLRLDVPGWSAQGAFLAIAIVLALATYGVRTSLGGQPLLRPLRAEE
jgi:hypothetical protein